MHILILSLPFFILFFFNDTATTEIYTLSLHDALPISDKDLAAPDVAAGLEESFAGGGYTALQRAALMQLAADQDRKSTRLNSSHQIISYAVFCLKKKKKK